MQSKEYEHKLDVRVFSRVKIGRSTADSILCKAFGRTMKYL